MTKKKIPEMNTEMIDKAYDYCKNMPCWKDETDFLNYWQDNYVKFCEDFQMGKYKSEKKRTK